MEDRVKADAILASYRAVEAADELLRSLGGCHSLPSVVLERMDALRAALHEDDAAWRRVLAEWADEPEVPA